MELASVHLGKLASYAKLVADALPELSFDFQPQTLHFLQKLHKVFYFTLLYSCRTHFVLCTCTHNVLYEVNACICTYTETVHFLLFIAGPIDRAALLSRPAASPAARFVARVAVAHRHAGRRVGRRRVRLVRPEPVHSDRVTAGDARAALDPERYRHPEHYGPILQVRHFLALLHSSHR